MAYTPEEVQAIVQKFEERYAAECERRRGPIGCCLCRHPARVQINRLIVEGQTNDWRLKNLFGIYGVRSVTWHRTVCLPKYSAGMFAQVVDCFPLQGGELAQKKFILNELLFLRAEALRREPLDRREYLRLTKEIDMAADAYRKAKHEKGAKVQAGRRRAKQGVIEDLSPQQLAEMQKIGEREATYGANGINGKAEG